MGQIRDTIEYLMDKKKNHSITDDEQETLRELCEELSFLGDYDGND